MPETDCRKASSSGFKNSSSCILDPCIVISHSIEVVTEFLAMPCMSSRKTSDPKEAFMTEDTCCTIVPFFVLEYGFRK